MVTVTIDRMKWLRGEGPEDSKLIRSNDGKMCCLGFYCLAKGVEPDAIIDVASPSMMGVENSYKYKDSISELVVANGSLALLSCNKETDALMIINDCRFLQDEAREIAIQAIGEKVGIKFEFV